eukprot:CAMPEP_0185432050 /NCGR_PEP_ID=MMETSP1365-20130426/18508_1 /TAXON_ID=38817 /ORGANISM="Gephyrocapsa oceanica, Strain RCC1303" /LENGTH=169 /DNA_ID=CAMNT_0028036403 /DNA_START=6 /DNA_END=513 /DNA_ORIENTATION=-
MAFRVSGYDGEAAAARASKTPARDSRFSMAFRVSGYDGEVAEKTELHSMMARFRALRTSQRLSGFWSPFASPSIARPPEAESDFRSPAEEGEAVAEDPGHSYRSDTSSHVISPSHEADGGRQSRSGSRRVRGDARAQAADITLKCQEGGEEKAPFRRAVGRAPGGNLTP